MSDGKKYAIPENRKLITGQTLKVIAVIVMLVDHTAAALLQPYINKVYHTQDQYEILIAVYNVMRAVGRTAFPIFCFMIVEGFHYTHNRFAYLRNIIIFAFISEYPFDMALFGHIDWTHQNVMFTLAAGLAVIWGIEAAGRKIQKNAATDESGSDDSNGISKDSSGSKEGSAAIQAGGDTYSEAWHTKNRYVREIDLDPDMIVSHDPDAKEKIRHKVFEEHKGYGSVWAGFLQMFSGMGILIAGILATYYLDTDYAMIGVVLIGVFYLLRGERIYAGVAGYAVMCWEPWSFPAFILIQFYNGKKGRGWKYFFYIFYPAHLFILYLIRRFCMGIV